MNKTILTVLLFCFVVFSAAAQQEDTKSTTSSQKNAVEQSKAEKQRMDAQRANESNQTNSQANNPNAPVIEFDKVVHDYGTIEQDADGNCEFTFTNKGKEPLILSNVCTGMRHPGTSWH